MGSNSTRFRYQFFSFSFSVWAHFLPRFAQKVSFGILQLTTFKPLYYKCDLPPPSEIKYLSALSQSSLVRQNRIAWSILCSWIAFTKYSIFRIFTASESVSGKGKYKQRNIDNDVLTLFYQIGLKRHYQCPL